MKIDLLEPIRYRLITQPAPPAPPIAVGTLIYVASSKTFQFWDGAAWVVLGPPANIGAGLPAAPSLGQVAFDTVTGQLSFWNGAAWISMAPPSPSVVPFPSMVDVPFNAGDFTGSGGMTWTVAAGNVDSFQYLELPAPSKVMMLSVSIAHTTVVAPLGQQLNIKIPNGRIPTKFAQVSGALFQGAPPVPGNVLACVAAPGTDHIICVKLDTTNPIADVGNTSVDFQIFFQYA